MYIQVKNVTKIYGNGENQRRVLDQVSLEVEKGEICVILGPSGSGKSTLLNAVGALETVEEGSIRVGEEELTSMKPSELAEFRRRSLGFVFQFYNLLPDLTVRENVEVCRYLAKEPLDGNELLQILGLSEHRDKFPAQLSGGQQQRCSIARALVKNPPLLLCDEPTGALDTGTAGEILGLLERVNKTYGTTILLVTHNEEIKKMASQVVYIRDGRLGRMK